MNKLEERNEKPRLVLYGNSLIIGTIRDSFSHSSLYDVVALPPCHENILEALVPDVVIFDLGTTHPEEAFRMLGNVNNLKLMGVSPDKNLVKVWSSRQLQELSIKDLMVVIDNQPNHIPAEANEGGSDNRGND
jgi:hypothetical protein